MKEVTLELQQLIFGDRNMFIFIADEDLIPFVSNSKVAKFLVKLEKNGYVISNPNFLFNISKQNFKEFKNQFFNLIEANTKDGFILRKTFAESEELTEYTAEEWMAIFAQYSITYGWSNEFNSEFGLNAEKVLEDYVDSLDLLTKNKIDNTKIKTFSIGSVPQLIAIIKSILESKSVLRSQQIKTLEATPKDILAIAAKSSNIVIKETLVKVMKLLSTEKLDFALLKTANDVLRFIVSSCAIEPIEGQINKTLLKSTKIRIPTSIRKVLLNNLELIAKKKAIGSSEGMPKELSLMDAIELKGIRYLCEDMFSYEDFWMIIHKYLRYENSKKMRAKFPLYTKAIDLLYEGDRSWTFNGRYSKAKEEMNYDKAILVAKERPGFLLRNIIEFVRMTKGTKLPVKKNSNIPLNNAFQNKLTGSQDNAGRIIKEDGVDFLLSEEFQKILSKSANTKLAWQLIEQLKNKSLFEKVYKRNVQGTDIEYSTPIPAVDKSLAKKVRKVILKYIKNRLKDSNKNVGKIYFDKGSYGHKLQYSGRDSTEISYAGEFLSPGTELNLLNLMDDKKIKNPLLRLGVMWRGKKSTDLDHSLTLDNDNVVYYGSPVAQSREGKVLVTSSGDITSCATENGRFSTELIDIDLLECKRANVKSMFNSFINFSGSTTIGELECYIFFSIINRSERVMQGSRVYLDLAKQDYAIRIDPDNTDKTGAYIGCSVDLVNNVIKVLSIPVKDSKGHFSNARSNNASFAIAIKNAKVDGLTIGYALNKVFDKDQFTDDVDEADIIISREEYVSTKDGAMLLHPGRNVEDINKFLFQG